MAGYYLPFGPEIALGQPFGSRPNLYPNPAGGHNGDDWLTQIGVPVRAAGDGEVIFAGEFDTTYADNFGWNLNYGGNMVVLNMDGETAPYFEYGHLLRFTVKTGDRVKAGQIIAYTGNSDGGTGVSSGPHCHVGCLPYNFNINSSTYGRVNPRLYMTKYWDSSGKPEDALIIEPTKLQDDDDMSVIAKDSNSTTDKNAVWIGDGIHRRLIPDPYTLAAMQKQAENGQLKIFRNGEVQDLPTATLGAYLDETVSKKVLDTVIPKQGAAKGGTTTLASNVAWDESNRLQLLAGVAAAASKNGASVEEIAKAMQEALSSGIKLEIVASVNASEG